MVAVKEVEGLGLAVRRVRKETKIFGMLCHRLIAPWNYGWWNMDLDAVDDTSAQPNPQMRTYMLASVPNPQQK